MIEAKTSNINIFNFDSDIVEIFINYIYTGKCNLNDDNVYDIFKISHFYEINKLQDACKDYLIKNLNINNAIDSLKLANIELYDLKLFKKQVKKFIKDNERCLIYDKSYIDYLMSTIKMKNAYDIFELSMKCNNDDFKNQVKNYFFNNYAEICKQTYFKNSLVNNPKWVVILLDYFHDKNADSVKI